MAKKKAKWEYLMDYIELDENGCSRIYSVKEIENYGKSIGVDLSFTGNGSSYVRTDTNGTFQKMYDYVLIKEKGYNYNVPHYDENGKLIPKGSGRILGIQFLGFNPGYEGRDHSIPQEVKDYYKGKPSVWSGSTTNIELDHKNGQYKVYPITIKDIQPLTKSENILKRQFCAECQRTDCRFKATNLPGYSMPYYYGGEKLSVWGCPGCFLYDIKKYREVATKNGKPLDVLE